METLIEMFRTYFNIFPITAKEIIARCLRTLSEEYGDRSKRETEIFMRAVLISELAFLKINTSDPKTVIFVRIAAEILSKMGVDYDSL